MVDSSLDADYGIRVSVVPAQAAFFAGEPFSVNVTFTNTRRPSAQQTRRIVTHHTHKRSAHSISSAPLSKPPTSPVTPRTSIPPAAPPAPTPSSLGYSRAAKPPAERKGLVGVFTGGRAETSSNEGTGADSTATPSAVRKNRSISASLSAQDIEEALSGGSSSAGPSFLRNSAAVFSPGHPHARKPSIVDGQQLITSNITNTAQSSSLAPLASGDSSAPPSTASASSSSFSLSLDTIAENATSGATSPATTPDGASVDKTHSFTPKRRPNPLGLGLGQPSRATINSSSQPRTALPTLTQPGAELILYAYAQVEGTLTLADSPKGQSGTSAAAAAHATNFVRRALLRRPAIGGGRMDISSSLEVTPTSSITGLSSAANGRRKGHARSTSLSASIMTLLSSASPSLPPSLPASPALPLQQQEQKNQRWAPGHRARTSSYLGSLLASSVSLPALIGSGAEEPTGTQPTLEEDEDEIPADVPLPTFDVQPTMLAIDLMLAPGESRSYTYTLPLPADLPPTFRGRIMKFAYTLIIGVCRSAPMPLVASGSSVSSTGNTKQSSFEGISIGAGAARGTTSRGSTSQIMRVPIRLYNHVDVMGVRPPYDFLRPLQRPLIAPGSANSAKVVEHPSGGIARNDKGKNSVIDYTATKSRSTASLSVGCTDPMADLREYAQRLLASFPDANGARDSEKDLQRTPSVPFPSTVHGSESEYEMYGQNGDEHVRCGEAVEILTRNMRRVSYDVNKDGVKVAVLTFTKSAYRLGETVIGVAEFNERTSRARVLKLSALLESNETLPERLSVGSQKLRRLHAEFHSSLIVSTKRTCFTLDIPSDGAPEFACTCDSLPFSGSRKMRELSQVGQNKQQGGAGGLKWTVRLCLLVSIASPFARPGIPVAGKSKSGGDGARIRQLLRDGPPGEWSSSWRATRGIAPLQNVDTHAEARALRRARRRQIGGARASLHTPSPMSSASSLSKTGGGRGWGSWLVELVAPHANEGDDKSDSDEGDDVDVDKLPGSGSKSTIGASDFTEPKPRPLPGAYSLLDDTRSLGARASISASSSTSMSSITTASASVSTAAIAVGSSSVDADADADFDAGLDVDLGGGDVGWSEMRCEMVECEVSISVWPANTAFRPMEVVFDV